MSMTGLILAVLIGAACIGQQVPWNRMDAKTVFAKYLDLSGQTAEEAGTKTGGTGTEPGTAYTGQGFDLPEMTIFDEDDPQVFEGITAGPEQQTAQTDSGQQVLQEDPGSEENREPETAPENGLQTGTGSADTGEFILPEIFD